MGNIIIIGGGIVGLMIAYELINLGVKNVTIIEKSFIGSGSTFRCATGIRASFTTKEHIELMKESINLWSKLSKELGFRYVRSGYLWILTNSRDVELFKRLIKFQNIHGIPSKLLNPSRLLDFIPKANVEGIKALVYDPLAGKASCFDATLRIYEELIRNGAKVLQDTEVLKIVTDNSTIKKVVTNRGEIRCSSAVIAAGYGSKKLISELSLGIPLRNTPKHALITESIAETFKPLVIDWSSSSYIVQTFHGGIIMGTDIEESGEDLSNRIDFIFKVVSIWAKYIPWIEYLNILRYWTGYYVMTPDHHPVLGPVNDIEGLYIATGFSGHGFMLAPIVGKVMARWIISGDPGFDIANKLIPDRFKRGELVKEVAVFG